MFTAFRWIIAAAMAAAVSLAGPPAIAAAGDPIAFAKTLYAAPELWKSIGATPESRSQYLTPGLAGWLVGGDGSFVDLLDIDPLAGGRPFLLSDKTFTVVSIEDSAARVKVDFKNYDRPQTVTLKMVISGDRWVLADIDLPSGSTLLRDLQQAVMCR